MDRGAGVVHADFPLLGGKMSRIDEGAGEGENGVGSSPAGPASLDPLSELLLGHKHNYPRCASNHGICSD